MELALQIRRLRNERNMSQDELAQSIYVSRQTVSNWERDKTYPDVHSLLLLSELFDTSVDELIKGDIMAMEDMLEHKELFRRMIAMTAVALAFILGGLVLLALGLYRFGWDEVPSYIIFALMGGIACALMHQVGRMTKKHDLVTYREIIAFSKGEPVDRNGFVSGFARRHALATKAVYGVVAAIVGFVVALLLVRIFR